MLILFHISYSLFFSLKYLFFPLYLCISLMVDFHRNILGIASIGKLHRICKAFIRKCRHNKKSSLFSNESKLVDQVKANQEIISEEDIQQEKGKITMNGSVHNSFRSCNNTPDNHDDHHHDDQRSPGNKLGNKNMYKHRSADTNCFPSNYFTCSPLSRYSASIRSLSRKSSTDSSSPPSPSPSPPPSFLGKNLSRRSSNNIMFSNSSGLLKPPPIERRLECTLEELCYGCQKKIKVTRDVVQSTGKVVQEEELLTIKVKPGWKKGTKITFEGMGNEKPGLANPADITFVVSEKRHQLFRREGDDLELAVEIPLVKALTGCDLSIPLLGGDKMSLNIDDDVIYPGFEKVVQGQGMPVAKHQGKRGNLKLTFLVEFPKELTDDQRSNVISILQGSS